MDGVLADFTRAALRRVEQYFGIKIGYDEVTIPRMVDLVYDRLPKNEKRLYSHPRKIYNKIAPPGFFEKLEPYEGVIDTLKELDKIHEVVIITKPLEWDNCPGEKYTWLKKYLGYKPKIMMVNAMDVKGMVNVDIMVDDDPRVIRSLELAIPIIVERPWNAEFLEFEAMHSVKTFNDVPNVIQKIAQTFYDPKIAY